MNDERNYERKSTHKDLRGAVYVNNDIALDSYTICVTINPMKSLYYRIID